MWISAHLGVAAGKCPIGSDGLGTSGEVVDEAIKLGAEFPVQGDQQSDQAVLGLRVRREYRDGSVNAWTRVVAAEPYVGPDL